MLVNIQKRKDSISYAGNISSNIINVLILDIDAWLIENNEPMHLKRKIITASIEMLQNILKHSKNKSGFIIVNETIARYEVGVGSVINKNDSEVIKSTLSEINFYSKEELDNKVNSILLNNDDGLCFLSLVMASDKKIDIDLKSFNHEDLFMVLNLTVIK